MLHCFIDTEFSICISISPFPPTKHMLPQTQTIKQGALKITRKQSTFGGSCQPANDLCPFAALVRLSSCQSAAGVLLWSRGAACGLIGVAWSCSTWKKSRCHLVTLRHAAKLLAGGWSGHVAEEGCALSTVVMNHCAAPLSPLTPPLPKSVPLPTLHLTPSLTL